MSINNYLILGNLDDYLKILFLKASRWLLDLPVSYNTMIKAIVLLFFVASLAVVEPHGFLRVPLARTSVHRLPNWGGAQQPFWWDDTGVWYVTTIFLN